MTKISKRRRFVLVLTGLGTIYGSLLAYRLLGAQPDILSDVLKLTLIVFFGLLVLSTFWWSVITRRIKGPSGGALAGFFTAICIIPVPTLIGGFKSQFALHDDIFIAGVKALQYSISTFSLAEYIALPLCFVTGYFLAK